MDRIPRKKKKQIPKDTPYCYTIKSGWIYPKEGRPYIKTKVCPFYKHIEDVTGYCKLIKYEVDDQVKSCEMRQGKY